MKYNQFAIKNNKGEYIQHSTAYSNDMRYTNSLYDVELWNTRECAEKLADYLNDTTSNKFSVVEV